MFESVLGPEASCLRRLGLLCAMLCGACTVLGILLLALQPQVSNLVATVVAAGMAGAGIVAARTS